MAFYTRFLPAKYRNPDPTIPVVRLVGSIAAGGGIGRATLNLSACASPLAKAFGDKKTPAVAIVINSPGGSPVQSHLIYKRIRDLAVEHKKKVHVFVEDVAASGGYMIACAGDDIHADPSSITGSIGVVAATFGFTEAIEKLGVERRVYTAGSNKSVLDPFSPAKESDIAHLKSLQLDIHRMFIDLVKASRGERLSDDDEIFSGLFWAGEASLERGLIDGIGDVRSVLKRMYGPKTKLSLIEVKRGLFGRPRSSIGASLVRASSIDLDMQGIAHEATLGALAALEERGREGVRLG